MTEQVFLQALAVLWLVLPIAVLFVLLVVAVPYGRHIRKGWGPTMPNKLGWAMMEAPALLVFVACFLLGRNRSLPFWILLGLWEAHYVHRALVYPLRLRGEGKRMPVGVAGMAFAFNLVNGYVNGRYLFTFCTGYPAGGLGTLRFGAGIALFVGGYAINRWSDRILRSLRGPGESGYKVPYGGLYRWVSCPNYLGEILEWSGWAIATWSIPGAAFAAWTVANLLPRARAHHHWYRQHFATYPPERKALLPGIW